jgi:hypothetical protein
VSGLIQAYTNIQTIPENSTLYFELPPISPPGSTNGFWEFLVNGSSVFYEIISTTTTTYTFLAGDELQISFFSNGVAINGTFRIKENNSSGRLIDEFAVDVID